VRIVGGGSRIVQPPQRAQLASRSKVRVKQVPVAQCCGRGAGKKKKKKTISRGKKKPSKKNDFIVPSVSMFPLARSSDAS
jgi:Fe-S oxidoreductase